MSVSGQHIFRGVSDESGRQMCGSNLWFKVDFRVQVGCRVFGQFNGSSESTLSRIDLVRRLSVASIWN